MKKLSSETTSLKPKLDWLTIIGDIPHINYLTDSIQIGMIDQIIENELGIPLFDITARRVYVCSRSGIQVSFEKLQNSGTPSIQISFKGTFFLNSNELAKKRIGKVLEFIWNRLSIKAAPRVSRYDIAVDIFDVKVGDVLPDIKSGKWEMVSNSKRSHQPIYQTFHAAQDLSLWTGSLFKNHKYKLRFYDRRLTLNLKQRKQHYIDYYNDLYRGHQDILRMELQISKGTPLKFFNTGFFIDEKPLDILLKECLAYFHKNHKLKSKKTGKECVNWPLLFFTDHYKSLKQYERELDLKVSFEEMLFYESNKNWEQSLNTLSKRMVAAGKIREDDVQEISKMLSKYIGHQIAVVDRERILYKRTQEVFHKFLKKKEEDWWSKELHRRREIAKREGFLKLIS